MTFNDIFKSSFLERVASFSVLDTIIALLLAFILGLFIFFVYKKTFSGVIYSSNFGISLISMAMITAMIILAISSNVILSLGMVGALSIVRFRTAVKDPMDISYLFWAISIGIVVGAGMIPLAVFGTVLIGIVLMVFANKKSINTPYLIIINCNNEESEKNVLNIICKNVKKQILKSKTVSKEGIEITFEIRLNQTTTEFVNQILLINGVSNAILVSYNGEYSS
jgi:uncharacterized membrane protein YhiD involved in acid resistance